MNVLSLRRFPQMAHPAALEDGRSLAMLSARQRSRVPRAAAALACCALLLTGCMEEPPTAATASAAPTVAELQEVAETAEPPAEPTAATGSEQTEAPSARLLTASGGGDGDSWKDTDGREYRLGLINTPESNECFGATATAKRKEMTAAGFQADVYETDAYGRSVAVVTTANGVNLNLWLARHGYANDKYLNQFRHENPSLASQLDAAFAAARAKRAGLWSACANDNAPAPLAAAPRPARPARGGNCDPSYPTVCIPPPEPDLDCPDVPFRDFEVLEPDPHRFDADGDGYGCVS